MYMCACREEREGEREYEREILDDWMDSEQLKNIYFSFAASVDNCNGNHRTSGLSVATVEYQIESERTSRISQTKFINIRNGPLQKDISDLLSISLGIDIVMSELHSGAGSLIDRY